MIRILVQIFVHRSLFQAALYVIFKGIRLPVPEKPIDLYFLEIVGIAGIVGIVMIVKRS